MLYDVSRHRPLLRPTFLSVQRLVRVARQAELAAVEMTEIQFRIEAYKDCREMDVATRALDRMRARA